MTLDDHRVELQKLLNEVTNTTMSDHPINRAVAFAHRARTEKMIKDELAGEKKIHISYELGYWWVQLKRALETVDGAAKRK